MGSWKRLAVPIDAILVVPVVDLEMLAKMVAADKSVLPTVSVAKIARVRVGCRLTGSGDDPRPHGLAVDVTVKTVESGVHLATETHFFAVHVLDILMNVS